MQKHLSVSRIIWRSAASGFRRLREEARWLMASLPNLRGAVDADDLPLAFILRRDSQAEGHTQPGETLSAPASQVAPRRASPALTPRRAGSRRQPSSE
jgi:hypothetical protein